MPITTKSDEYLRERWESKSRWHITLSDGTEVYQDDERSGRPSWKDLRDFLIDNPHLSISKMYFGFRDNCVSLPDEADGYYFRYGLLSSFGGFEKHSFLVGYLEEGYIKVMKYELPEMTYLGEEIRDYASAGESLIVCNKNAKIYAQCEG